MDIRRAEPAIVDAMPPGASTMTLPDNSLVIVTCDFAELEAAALAHHEQIPLVDTPTVPRKDTMDSKRSLLLGTAIHQGIDAATFLGRQDNAVLPADLSAYESAAARPSTSEAAAAIRADRAARKAANFAKRNPGRAGIVWIPILAAGCLAFGLLLFLAGEALAAERRKAERPLEPAAKPLFRRLAGTEQHGQRSAFVLTDPASGHRWLVIGEAGTAIVPLQPEEFPK
jgi:hypothetical protein